MQGRKRFHLGAKRSSVIMPLGSAARVMAKVRHACTALYVYMFLAYPLTCASARHNFSISKHTRCYWAKS